jgi:hypothetical protein
MTDPLFRRAGMDLDQELAKAIKAAPAKAW